MKLRRFVAIILCLGLGQMAAAAGKPLRVVTTLPDYADIAERIGGDRVEVEAIVHGEQDAHYIRPKPSFVAMVRRADLLIDTGLDLEMWLPTVMEGIGHWSQELLPIWPKFMGKWERQRKDSLY